MYNTMGQHPFNEITPGIFLGSRFGLYEFLLKKHRITHLLSLDNFKKFPPGFQTKTIDIEDEESENILKYFEECIEFIGKNRTLVFCTAGRSRSASIVAAYLIKKNKISLSDALDIIKKARRVNPNPGFMIQLKQWEKMNCELCQLEKRTEWLLETEDIVCVLCDQCDLPMVIYKPHTSHVPEPVRHQMTQVLNQIAPKFIKKAWYIDTKQRSIFNHIHWHARPILYKI